MAAPNRFLLKTFSYSYYLNKLRHRNWTSQSVSKTPGLCGRDVISPDQLSRSDLKALLWTAVEMKSLRQPAEFLRARHVTLVFDETCVRYQLSFERAVHDLGANFTTYIHHGWAQQPDITDSGRLLSSLTDVVVCSGVGQIDLEQLASGCTVPVINCSSNIFSLVKALADFLTILETGPLRRKCLAWVGPPTALCNAYICLAPKLGLNLRVFCVCPEGNGQMSAVSLAQGYALCGDQAELHECSSTPEAVYRADIIATAPHQVSQHSLTLKVLEEAALEWYLLHALPRTTTEVTDDVFRHKHNLTWKSVENTRYVAMALLLQVLRQHKPSSPMPDFDGPP